jgi:hypothetical protein
MTARECPDYRRSNHGLVPLSFSGNVEESTKWWTLSILPAEWSKAVCSKEGTAVPSSLIFPAKSLAGDQLVASGSFIGQREKKCDGSLVQSPGS